mgnify:CR=1 FL=1
MGHTPSKLLGVKRWASRKLGMPDRITALSFDTAVMTFGIWAENRLGERNEDGLPLWSLEELLGKVEPTDNAQQFAALKALMGM